MSPPLAGDAGELKRGTIFAFLAYGIWGLFPLYFHALEPSGAFEILAHRILWTMLFCVVVLVVRRDFAWVSTVVRRPKLLGGLSLAALLIAVNWVVYVLAVITGRTYAAALGYFLNPIVTVGLGVFVLRERLRPMQWAAVSVGAIAAVYLTVAGGEFPWIAVSLAFSFAFYGLVKKKVGASLDAMHSLTVETLVLAPVAVGVLVWLASKGSTTFGEEGAAHTSLLVAAGVVTAIPLLFFAAAARRIPLVTIGLIQFLTPMLQLLIGVVLLGEHVTGALWVGFGIVWIALLLLTIDSLRQGQTNRRARLAEPEPCP
ncbi:EamA family transporter RarD [Knoellia sp. S7-12]|uniref:EamA family transporter RarD n=1 Tax=Knoellia sp. S7-12 TaxID=3126698 RepID=UPI003369B560